MNKKLLLTGVLLFVTNCKNPQKICESRNALRLNNICYTLSSDGGIEKKPL